MLTLLWRYAIKSFIILWYIFIYWYFLLSIILGINNVSLCLLVVETSTGVFSSEPKDVCAVNGQDVFFPCEYNNTAESFYSVSWRINERTWSASRLPPNHRQNATGLVVRIDTSNNQSTYSCIIRIFSESVEGEFESNRAVLTVVAPDSVSNIGICARSSSMTTKKVHN